MSRDEGRGTIEDADVVVVGPAPPLRGGIAAHTARLSEHLGAQGRRVVAASYSRLYPPRLFPGRAQRTAVARPPWCEEILDTLRPGTWHGLGRRLRLSDASVVLQWWHPMAAPALLEATRGLGRERLAVVCHNVLPHERFPLSATLARLVLRRCARVVCHSHSQADAARALLGPRARFSRLAVVPLPCLVAAEGFATGVVPPEVAALGPQARYLAALGHVRPYKGLPLLLRAWSRARERAPGGQSWRLLVVGECYLRGRARREALDLASRDTSIVIVDRYVEDAEFVQFLALSSGVVAAHLDASQSGVLPLALALGLPGIVSDRGGLAEQVAPAPGGSSRFVVVPAAAEDELATAIAALLDRRTCGGVHVGARREPADFDGAWRSVIEALGIGARP